MRTICQSVLRIFRSLLALFGFLSAMIGVCAIPVSFFGGLFLIVLAHENPAKALQAFGAHPYLWAVGAIMLSTVGIIVMYLTLEEGPSVEARGAQLVTKRIVETTPPQATISEWSTPGVYGNDQMPGGHDVDYFGFY